MPTTLPASRSRPQLSTPDADGTRSLPELNRPLKNGCVGGEGLNSGVFGVLKNHPATPSPSSPDSKADGRTRKEYLPSDLRLRLRAALPLRLEDTVAQAWSPLSRICSS